ncbi:DUF421 domain-containing protein [Hymenobacter sp. NBH84]|uniref:DUF421 domain-containing protein n=1 Tax=Hymenobacter defluvii TaxID=2054411 RepID=A0ABS3TB53_9BACT|nr:MULTISPECIES: YetF domain-containing protein [Hymenobacter]MBO3270872.1 DUF421 domain-containing protein [Hymenobacter defluvii]QNE39588.1 DUF421 domain-containing protein [Hymenobacter sp. NBH84]
MFFNGWAGVGRTVIMAVLVYVAIILLIRITGKRTLAKMNAFDMIVTVALGSSLASVALSKSTRLVEGIVGIGTLLALQFVVSWLSVRSKTVRKLVKSEPRLLFHEGNFLDSAMHDERVTHDEVRSAVRKEGGLSMEKVTAVVLETDGTFSVIKRPDDNRAESALQGVDGVEQK